MPETWHWDGGSISLSANQLPAQGRRGTGQPPPSKEWMGTDPPMQKEVASSPLHVGSVFHEKRGCPESSLACRTQKSLDSSIAPSNSFGEQQLCRTLVWIKEPQSRRALFPPSRPSTPMGEGVPSLQEEGPLGQRVTQNPWSNEPWLMNFLTLWGRWVVQKCKM